MEHQQTSVDWHSIVFSDWITRLDRTSLKRFGQPVIAEEATTYVLDKLSHDNWSVLSSYQNKAQPRAYLNAVSANLLEEFARSKFGRPRPPVWLKRCGELWVNIWREVCLERQLAGSVVDKWVDETLSHQHVEKIIGSIKSRLPWCGAKHEEIPESAFYRDDDESAEPILSAQPAPPPAEEDNSFEEILLLVRMMVSPDEKPAGYSNLQLAELSDKVAELTRLCQLTDRELLILRLIYVEKIKQALVAETFDLKPYQLSKQLSKLMLRLRDGLQQAGIDQHVFFPD